MKSALAVAICTLCAAACTSHRTQESSPRENPAYDERDFSAFERTVAGENPKPVSVSPDGTMLAVKRALYVDDRFELLVTSVKDGHQIARIETDSQKLIAWSPDSKAIAFGTNHGGAAIFQMWLWRINGKLQKLDVPVTRSAYRLIRWSPNSRRFAYFLDDVQGGVCTVDTETLKWRVPVRLRSVADYAWAPDNQRLAVIDKTHGNELLIVREGDTLGVPVRVPTPGQILQHLVWRDQSTLVVGARGENEERFALLRMAVPEGRVEIMWRGEGDVIHPTFAGDDLYFTEDIDGFENLWRISPNLEPRKLNAGDGENSFAGGLQQGLGVFVDHTGLRNPRQIVKVPFDRHKPSEVLYQASSYQGLTSLPGVKSRIKSRDGLLVPIIKWRPPQPSCKGAILQIHGGPDLQIRPTYNSLVDALSDRGFVVAAVNYRGSEGYGERFLSREKDFVGMVDDISAAVEELRVTDKCDQVVLLGASFGAALAVALAQRESEHIAGIVIGAYSGRISYAEARPASNVIVHAYHGENDKISPAVSRAAIEKQFGDDVFTNGRGKFEALPGEGHVIVSWAKLGYSAMTILAQRAPNLP